MCHQYFPSYLFGFTYRRSYMLFIFDTSNSYSDSTPTVDGRDMGKPQSLDGDDDISSKDIEDRIAESQSYMSKQLQMKTLDPEILRICKNDDASCTYWR